MVFTLHPTEPQGSRVLSNQGETGSRRIRQWKPPTPWMQIKTPLHSSFVYFGCPIKILLKKVFYGLKIKVRKFPKRPRSRLLIFKQSSLVWNIGSHKLKGASDCSFPTIWRDNICANTLRIKKVYVNWSQHKSFNPVWSFLKSKWLFHCQVRRLSWWVFYHMMSQTAQVLQVLSWHLGGQPWLQLPEQVHQGNHFPTLAGVTLW